MSYEDDYKYDDGTSSYYVRGNDDNINPRDSYGQRFSVTHRKTGATPRPAIVASNNHIKEKDRIFTKRHSQNRSVGKVDMAAVAETASRISKKKENKNVAQQDSSQTQRVNSFSGQNNNSGATQKMQPVDKQANQAPNDPTLETFRSSGLDSLFCSTAPSAANESVANAANTNQSTKNTTVDSVNLENANTSLTDINNQEKPTELVSQKVASDSAAKTSQRISVRPNVTDNQVNPAQIASEQFKKLRGERKLRIIRPTSFNSTKDISSALSAGNAVVLACHHLSEDNSRRILDFAFGAASMCGAKVSLEGDMIFSFTTGNPLTKRERLLCIKDGLVLHDNEEE